MGKWTRFGAMIAFAGLAALPVPAWADFEDGGHMMWGAGGMAGMGGLFGIIMMLVMVALIAIVVALIWRAVNPGSSGTSGDDSALTILKERFARGEIDKNEFDERRRVLKA